MEPEVEESFSGREISFKVKKAMMGRIGIKQKQNVFGKKIFKSSNGHTINFAYCQAGGSCPRMTV